MTRDILAVIPARGGSKGIARKNLRLLGGHPLVAWAVRSAQEARCITRVVVSTDDAEIATVARKYGAEVPFLRPAELAEDRSRVDEAVDHLLQRLAIQGYFPDAVAVLLPSHPFRPYGLLDHLCSRVGVDCRWAYVTKPIRLFPGRFCSIWDGRLVPMHPAVHQNHPGVPVFRRYGLAGVFGTRDSDPDTMYALSVEDPVHLLDIDLPLDLEVAREVVRCGWFTWDMLGSEGSFGPNPVDGGDQLSRSMVP